MHAGYKKGKKDGTNVQENDDMQIDKLLGYYNSNTDRSDNCVLIILILT